MGRTGVSPVPLGVSPSEIPSHTILLRALARTLLLWLAVTLLAGQTLAEEPKREGSQIAFLHLRRDASGVRLLSAEVRPGRLKSQPRQGTIDLELTAADGAIVYAGRLPDPLWEVLEYEDPDRPGELKSRLVQREAVEFSLRVPRLPAARTVRLFARPQPGSTLAAQADRQLLGEFPLP